MDSIDPDTSLSWHERLRFDPSKGVATKQQTKVLLRPEFTRYAQIHRVFPVKNFKVVYLDPRNMSILHTKHTPALPAPKARDLGAWARFIASDARGGSST